MEGGRREDLAACAIILSRWEGACSWPARPSPFCLYHLRGKHPVTPIICGNMAGQYQEARHRQPGGDTFIAFYRFFFFTCGIFSPYCVTILSTSPAASASPILHRPLRAANLPPMPLRTRLKQAFYACVRYLAAYLLHIHTLARISPHRRVSDRGVLRAS